MSQSGAARGASSCGAPLRRHVGYRGFGTRVPAVGFAMRHAVAWHVGICAVRQALVEAVVLARSIWNQAIYFASHRGAFIFASEPRALLAAGVRARANLPIAAQYLALGVCDHSHECFFSGIQQLAAGHSVWVDKWTRVGKATSLEPFPDAAARARLRLRSSKALSMNPSACICVVTFRSEHACLAAWIRPRWRRWRRRRCGCWGICSFPL